MAVLLNTNRDTFDVILSIDSALDTTEEDFKMYQQTMDESFLKFKPGMEPTRFVMRKVLSFALAKKVQNEQVGSNEDGKPTVQLSFINEEVKAALIDIKNPADLPQEQWIKYEKDKDGTTSTALMELLISADLVMELYQARQRKLNKGSDLVKKK